MTHKELVDIAYRWLLKNGKVGVVFKELVSIDPEIPDVIGFNGWESILIECKVSKSDFLKDKKKKHRLKGMGNWRFFCCPSGLIKKEALPERWGLIYVNEKGKARIEYDCRVKKIRCECKDDWDFKDHPEGFYFRTLTNDENRFDADLIAERRIMYSALRRLFIKGYVKYIYDKAYNRHSTVNDLININE